MVALPRQIGDLAVESTPHGGLRVVRADPVVGISLQLIQQADPRRLRVDADGTIVICNEVCYQPETIEDNGRLLLCRRVD